MILKFTASAVLGLAVVTPLLAAPRGEEVRSARPAGGDDIAPLKVRLQDAARIVKDLQTDVELTSLKMKDKDERIGGLIASMDAGNKKVAALEEAIKTAGQKAETFNGQLGELNKRNSSLETSVRDLTSKLTDANETLAKLKADGAAYKKDAEKALEDVREKLTTQLKATTTAASEGADQLKQITSKHAQATEELSGKQKQLAEAAASMKALREQFGNMISKAEAEAMRNELETSKKETAAVSTAAQEAAEIARAKISELDKKLNQTQAELEAAKKQAQAQGIEKATQTARIEELQAAIKDSTVRAKELQAKLEADPRRFVARDEADATISGLRKTIAKEQETRAALEKKLAATTGLNGQKLSKALEAAEKAKPAPAAPEKTTVPADVPPAPLPPAPPTEAEVSRIKELETTVKALSEENATSKHENRLLEFQLEALRGGTPQAESDPTLGSGSSRDTSVEIKPALAPGQRPQQDAFGVDPIFYAEDGYDADSESRRVYDQAKNILERFPAATFMITGHYSGERRESANLRLSKNRAELLTKYLITHGIPEHKVTTAAAGASRPLVQSTGDKKTRLKNRRIEVNVTHSDG